MSDTLGALESGAIWAAKGAAAGSVVPGIGTAIGAAAGGLLGVALKIAPGLLPFATQGSRVAQDAAAVVQAVTGQTDPAAAQAALAENQAMASDLQQRLAEIASDELATRLADVQDARARDVQVRTVAGGRNVRADLMLALTVVGIVGSLMVAILGRLDGNSAIFGLIAGLVGLFSKCFADAFSFEFGSSRGSQMKDGTISEIARNGIPMDALPKPVEITSGR